MRSFLAALRTLVLPYGATNGARIILDGVNGEIRATGPSGTILLSVSGGQPSLDFLDTSNALKASILFDNVSGRWFYQGVKSNVYFDQTGIFFENASASGGVRFDDASSFLYHGTVGSKDDWTVPAFANGWTGSNFAYKRFADGYVRFRGALVPGTRTGGTTVFTLPVGFRPVTGNEFVCSWSGGAFWNKIGITTGGLVQYFDGTASGSAGFSDNIGFTTI